MTTDRHGVPVGALTLWFGVFGAAVAWSLQELVGYAVVARSCLPRAAGEGPAGALGATTALSVGLLLVGAAAGLVAYRTWRRTAPGRPHFMALSGVLVSGLFGLGLLANLVVLFLVSPCGGR
jgi:formate hydrogenlyase subunit 3/multisubunit Na+/H+ antiporter MnhD subunit